MQVRTVELYPVSSGFKPGRPAVEKSMPRFGEVNSESYYIEKINHQPGRLLLVSGPSGVGKGTVIKEALKDPKVKATLSTVQSITTRNPRPGELPTGWNRVKDDLNQYAKFLVGALPPKLLPNPVRRWINKPSSRQYYFLSQEKFLKLKEKGKLFQSAYIDGNYYGSYASEVIRKMRQGNTVLFELKAQDALSLKQHYPKKVTATFISPPPPEMEVLRERLEGRGTNSPESIKNRLELAKAELDLRPQFDHVIVNDKLNEAIDAFKSLILSKS